MRQTTVLALSTALSVSAFLVPAHAQQQTAEARDAGMVRLDEIVVSARKRDETLIDVPLAITAFSADKIEKAGLSDFADVAMQTPSLSFRQGFGRTGGGSGGANNRPSLRGMSNILGSPNVGYFVDGVAVSGNITSYQLDNLERIEVLRGPQSALFGRGTFAGAVSFVTRKPTNDVEGRVKLKVGQFSEIDGSAYISGPLVEDKVLFEVDGRYYSFGGDYKNAANGKRDINDQKTINFGGKLIFKPTENLEVIASAGYSRDRDKGFAYGWFGSTKMNCFLPNIVGTTAGVPRSSNRSRGYFCGEIEGPQDLRYNIDAIEALGYHGGARDAFRSYLRADYNVNDWTLTSITALNKSKNQNGYDNTLNRVAAANLTIEGSKTKDFSQELRILSPADAPLRGLIGGYFYKEDDGSFYSVTGTGATAGAIRRGLTDDGVRNRAVFGQLEYDVTEQLTLTADARYQQDEIIGTTDALGPENGVAGNFTNRRVQKYNAFLPRVIAQYAVTEDVNIRASVAKGNKPGGFNDLPTNIIAPDLARLIERGLDVYDEESTWNYEIGAKARIADRFYIDAAAYYIDWTSQQLTLSEVYVQQTNGLPNSTAFIQNAGKSRIKGFEIDMTGQLTDWLNIRLGYAFNDGKFKEFYDENTEELFDTDGRASYLPNGTRNPADVDTVDGQVAGNKLPQTPRHKLVVSPSVNFDVSDDTSVFFRTDLSYESKRYVQVHNLAHTGDSYNMNINAGIERGNLTLTFFVDNVLQDTTPLVVTRLLDFGRTLFIPNPVTGGNRFTFFRDFSVTMPRKRQFGVTASYKF